MELAINVRNWGQQQPKNLFEQCSSSRRIELDAYGLTIIFVSTSHSQ